MDDRDLENLLSGADRPAPVVPADLPARVRHRDRRNRRGRRAATAAAVLVLFVGVAAVIAIRSRQVDAPPPVMVVDHRRTLDALAARIRDKREVIDGLIAVERRAELAEQLEAYAQTPAMALDANRDRAAGALLEYAAEMSKRAGGAPVAQNEYRRVIQLFPDSPLALAARQGLKGIEH